MASTRPQSHRRWPPPELDANAQLAALKSFSGVVPHATHYGPLLATVEKGRIVKIEAQASDKMPTAMLTEGVLDRTYDKTRVAGAMVRKSYPGVGTKRAQRQQQARAARQG